MEVTPLVPGDPWRLGEYALAGRLGAGGQGVVYEAYDPYGRRVAIKMLRADLLTRPDLRARFVKEVLAAQRITPFCTARVIAAEFDGDQPYVVSEYVEGPTLQQAVRDHGVYRGGELYRLATGIATALAAVHEAGVIHRDLKPGNVILGPDGPRVIDFGIARVEGTTLTDNDGQLIGTPPYMSPEQVNGEGGPASDVWAWGAVVVFAATGTPPFGTDTPALLHRILTQRPDLSKLDGPLRELVGAAMAYDPRDRPTARTLLLRLVGGRDPATPLLEAGSATARGVRVFPQIHANEPGTRANGPIYRTGGPVNRADPSLGDLAEAVYARLAPADQALVPGLLLRLVSPGDGADVDLRRVHIDDLLADGTGPADVARVLAAFADAGIVVRDGDQVRLASIAVIPAWPRLRAWWEASRDLLRVHSPLGRAARAWQAGGRDPKDLYRGAALRAALELNGGHAGDLLTLNRLERSFLDASVARERRQERRRRQIKAGVALLVALTLVAAGVLIRRGQLQRNVIAAQGAAKLADTLRATAPREAMLLSVAAWRLAPREPEAVAALYRSVAQRELDVFSRPSGSGAAFALGPGDRLAVADVGTATLWDVASGRRSGGAEGIGRGDVEIALSPDGRRLAVGSRRSIRLWNLGTGRPVGPPFGVGATRLSFNATGSALVARTPADAWQVWDVSGVPALRTAREASADVVGLEVSGDGLTTVDVRYDGGYLLSSPLARAPLVVPGAPDPAEGRIAALSPDNRTLALADGADVRFWDIPTGEWSEVTLVAANAIAVSYSANGDYLATYDGAQISLWTSGGIRLLRHAAPVLKSDVRFGARNRTLNYLSGDGTVTRLDIADLTRRGVLTPRAEIAALSPDGRYAVTAGRTVELLAVSPRRRLRTLRNAAGTTRALAFSADGRSLAVGGVDPARVTVWNVPAGTLRTSIEIDAAVVGGLAFNPVDGTLAVAPLDRNWHKVQIWDPRRGRMLRELPYAGGGRMAFSPDGRTLAVNGGDNGAVIDLATGKARPRPFGVSEDGVLGLAYGRTGGVLATGWTGTGVDLWDAATLRPRKRLRLPPGDADQFGVVAFGPDDRLLAAGGPTGRVWLWDTAVDEPVGIPLPAHAGDLLALAFAPDGGSLYSLGVDGVLERHDIDPERVAAAVCARAASTLTERQWEQRIRDAAYIKVC
ncbi:WD40 repeat domain-containing serine/threonine-protein kinase [Thermopolyspora sp. NPDC052614]|uniref:WD40 repeat domain-containing serine/threonine-protein kinase n=1 Tax=Thermopolyspora sp. NPDC052614 TaxID=3155682 RepID=UPI00341DF780